MLDTVVEYYFDETSGVDAFFDHAEKRIDFYIYDEEDTAGENAARLSAGLAELSEYIEAGYGYTHDIPAYE